MLTAYCAQRADLHGYHRMLAQWREEVSSEPELKAGIERFLAASVAEHYRLIALTEKGAVDEIKTLMRNHIRTWEPIFVDAITKAAREPRPLPSRESGHVSG